MDDLPARPDFLPPGFGTVGHRDFVELSVPELVSFTPRTLGWYVLAAVLAVALAAALTKAVQRHRRNAYRRAALAELARLRADAQGGGRSAALVQLLALLKRASLAAFSRERVAALSGERWLGFLERTAPGALGPEARAGLRVLSLGQADQLTRGEEGAVFEAVERWIRSHRA